MKNVLLISADFPVSYYQFAKAYKKNGCTVLVIGSTPYNEIHPELKSNVDEYIQCGDMENVNKMCEIVGYLQNKYGPIEYLESNNEYWLRNDSIIRERFGISSGIYPHQLDEYQKKSSLKKFFLEAGFKVAPYMIVKDFEELKKFAEKYGYPLFSKPDIGVGAAGNYKIDNFEQLEQYWSEKPMIDYIIEPFVKGQIISFDGIADANSEVVVAINEIFPSEIFDYLKTGADMFYFVNNRVPDDLLALGKKLIKAMGLKNRFFHTELFVAENEVPGAFEKGDIVGLEVNIRTPGGFTPDLLNYSLSTNLYQMLADVICFGKTDLKVGERNFAACASRRRNHQYFYNEEDIKRTFSKELCKIGDYPDVFSGLMGNRYFMAKFDNLNDVELFNAYVSKRTDESIKIPKAISRLLGEDKRILDDRKREELKEEPICDRHIDGA